MSEDKSGGNLECCAYIMIAIGMAMFYTAGASGFGVMAVFIILGLILLCLSKRNEF